MKLSELYLDRFLYRDNNQDSETKDSSFVSADSSDAEPASIPSGGAAVDVNTGNVMIDSALIPSTTINVGDYGWTQSCAFSSDDTDTVIWGGGDFIDAVGNSYSIDAGTTGDIIAKTYIYLSLLESETVYQKSTTSSDSVGTGKVLIAVAKNETDAATYNLVQAEQIVGDNILVNTIDAGKIVVGSLIVGTNVAIGTAEDAAGVTTIVGNTVDTGYVNALSITATGQITAGSLQVINGGNTIGFTPAGVNAIFAGPTGTPTFYVTPAGALTATSVTITGDVTATAGSDWTGNAIASAYIGNLDASKITTGSLSVSRTDADVTQTALTAGASIDNAKANGVTLITGGYISTGIISADNINTGTLSVSRTDAKCTDATANNTQTALTAGASIDNAKANGVTLITGGYISTGIISADNINTGTLSANRISTGSLNANKITSNTITGTQIATSLLTTTGQHITGGLKVGGAGASTGSGVVYATAYFVSPKLKLVSAATNPSVAGDIVNYASGATDQFRGMPGDGSWTGSFDMTAY